MDGIYLLRVLSESNSMNTNMTGFQNFALNESSLIIGRVKELLKTVMDSLILNICIFENSMP